MSASSQDYGGGNNWPRKVATGRTAGRSALKSAKSMDSLQRPQSQQQLQQTLPSQVPRIDLTNFDSPEFDGLDYVLTSPRSLEACHQLGLKPVQLLYKRLQDFELENPGLPVAKLFEMYDKYEAQRKEALRLARLERDKLTLLDLQDESKGLAASTPDLRRPAGQKPAEYPAGAVQAADDAISNNSWEAQVRRELADHEKQAERLRQRLESQRMRRLDESKARRDRERQLADESRRYAEQLEQQQQLSWEQRRREAETRRLAWERQEAEASKVVLRDQAELLERAERARGDRETDAIRRRHLRLKRKEEAHRERSASQRRSASRDAADARDGAEEKMRSAARNRELAQEKKQTSLRGQIEKTP